jgi:15-cis-phytoene synthase
MTANLEESYRYCRQLTQQTAKNFYYSFLVMPAAKRQAMSVIYAFMRRSDDISDDAGSPEAALEGLRAWRQQLEKAFNNEPISDSILPALVDVVRHYRIPQKCFFELLDGTEMDQTITRYETFDALYQYCYRVASCVGLVVLPIFGYDDERALVPAEACGIAFQLTNILRDVKEDAGRGRIYLPIEDLRRFGVSEEDIMNSRMTPGFLELMKYESARAREYYRQASPLLGMISPDSRGTLAVMMGIYGGILDKIEQNNYSVFGRRMGLSTMEKLWVVLKNWRKK